MKISIITTTYNAEKFIKKTIDSVLNQTFKDYEYIIIDDCSKDNTIKVIEELLNPQIIFIKNEKNLWIVWTRNKALNIARWKYFCFLDHDDVWKDLKKLEKQVNYLDKNNDVWLVWSFVEFIDKYDNVIWNFNYEVLDEKIRKKILIYNQFSTCSVMFRKKILEKSWLLNEKYDKVDDYDLWLRMWNISKFANIGEYLVQYRKMDTNTSRSNINFIKMKFMHLKLIFKNFNNYPNWFKAIIFNLLNLMVPYKVSESLRPIYKKMIW